MPSNSNNNGNKKSGAGDGKPKRKNVGKSKGPSEEMGRKREESEGDDGEGLCQVCMNKMTVFSVGQCNHAICFVCSTRMRVLCQKNECAICRQDMPMVYLTSLMMATPGEIEQEKSFALFPHTAKVCL